MHRPWDILIAYGLPDGAPRPRPTSVDFGAIRAALAAIDPGILDTVSRVVLLAWLDGWHDHWPSRFERELGELGQQLRLLLRAHAIDPNRYLKLRRIGVENLSGVL